MGLQVCRRLFVIDPDGYVAHIHIGPVDAETLMSELAELMKMD